VDLGDVRRLQDFHLSSRRLQGALGSCRNFQQPLGFSSYVPEALGICKRLDALVFSRNPRGFRCI
jgi:hypothetical protein